MSTDKTTKYGSSSIARAAFRVLTSSIWSPTDMSISDSMDSSLRVSRPIICIASTRSFMSAKHITTATSTASIITPFAAALSLGPLFFVSLLSGPSTLKCSLPRSRAAPSLFVPGLSRLLSSSPPFAGRALQRCVFPPRSVRFSSHKSAFSTYSIRLRAFTCPNSCCPFSAGRAASEFKPSKKLSSSLSSLLFLRLRRSILSLLHASNLSMSAPSAPSIFSNRS